MTHARFPQLTVADSRRGFLKLGGIALSGTAVALLGGLPMRGHSQRGAGP